MGVVAGPVGGVAVARTDRCLFWTRGSLWASSSPVQKSVTVCGLGAEVWARRKPWPTGVCSGLVIL